MVTRWKTLVAGAATCALSLMAVVAGGGAAVATELTPPGGSGGGAGSASASQPTPTLTVHKYTTPAGEEGDGTEKAPGESKNKPVEGVEYTVYKINNINLNKNADWETAANMQKAFEANPSLDQLKGKYDDSTKKVMKTNSDGKATFTFEKGTKGLYVVVESSIAGAKVGGKLTQVVGSKPFMVAVPMTDRTTHDKWNYNVHVYPKNSPVTAVKTVNDTNARKVGDTVTFTITTDIPDQTGTKLNKYVVLDKLDSAHYENGSVQSVQVKDGEILADNTDYTKDVNDGLVKVSFNSTGLEKLEKHRGGKVITTINATVKAVGESNSAGEYTNTAYVVPSNDYSENIGGTPGVPGKDGKLPPIPSNGVTEKFAKIVVNKQSTDGTKLAGAVFQLFTCNSVDDPLTTPLTINKMKDFKTAGSEGQVTINGVRQSDFYNGQQQTNKQYYCLKEITAPNGYELLPKPILLDVSNGSVTHGTYTVNVKNVKYNAGFHLPLTGSNAAILLVIVGVLLLSGGMILVARKRRLSL